MSLLCDLFVNSREEALAYESTASLDRSNRIKRFAPVEFKGLTSLEFGTLWAILENEEWNPEKHMLIDVAFGEGGESWLHQFQDEYVALLSKLEETDVNAAAHEWSQTEELSCSADDIHPVVVALVRLSQQSISQCKGLYMWGSL
ncbi:hypothetical protein HNQ59_001798 [Chitinivorax tropicus]|uniref:Uncharacterized protein n=1 Tax=Chitinivorax tropicus TaxID=714531 RepID=A0A840MN27_9PROT|nr:hypothetical protein [Chitinivorax tropicus]MBB5018509.1 hypothetical protein [Chitinivorax tropicus]